MMFGLESKLTTERYDDEIKSTSCSGVPLVDFGSRGTRR
jgi:hypothetical protein